MSEYKNAVIESAKIEIEDHGLLTVWLGLDYGDSCHQGFGGYCLFNPNFPGNDRAGFFIRRVMDVAGVKGWDHVPGRTVRVRADYSGVTAIGHILKDDWFTPSTDMVTP